MMGDTLLSRSMRVLRRYLDGSATTRAKNSHCDGSGYIGAAETIRAARERGLTVSDYVEALWNQKGLTDRIIEEMGKAGCLTPTNRVCEIGPGTGRYLERIINRIPSIAQYDIYEIAGDWAVWLEQTYAPLVARQPADGRTLRSTADVSCGIVHAHGVFVYLPILRAFEYFAEMARVTAPGGYIVFDFYASEYFSLEILRQWLSSADRYPVVLPRQTVIAYFESAGFRFLHSFDNKHGHGYSHYLVFRKG